MKNVIFGLLLVSLTSCTSMEPTVPRKAGCVRVEIPISKEEMESQTRAMDENSIRNVNYYLIGSAFKEVIHGYEPSAILRFECPPGTYDLYVIANMHCDLGSKTAAELQSLKLDYTTQYDDLPMWVKSSVTIPAQSKNTLYRLPAIKVQRGLAKVVVNLQSTVPDIILTSIRVVNIPVSSTLFDQKAAPSTNGNDYTEGPIKLFTPMEDSYTAVYYLPENLQGECRDITSQEMKGPDHAPQYATYLLIRADNVGQALAYRIYLGTNNTTNFDLRRNTCYTLNIKVQGTNEVDTRVTSYDVRIGDDYSLDSYGGIYYLPGSARTMNLRIIGENSARLRGKLVLEKGEASDFTFNGQSGLSEYDFDIKVIDGNNRYSISYTPQLINRSNSLLQYTVIVYDEGGIQIGYRLQYRFANSLKIYPFTNNGKVTITGALYSATASDGTVTALCYDNGCTLEAVPDAHAVFQGWFADDGFSRLLSTDTHYTYKPTEYKGNIYARFNTGIALDAAGTANCYIAPKRNTYYSFNATVKGNNKATTNISTGKLNGVEAKIIWETGTSAGSVVSKVAYLNGRILFQSGSNEGNAVIGLFNANGKCIWSWHIWATDYDPNLTGQTYRGGTSFMDRNIGALSANPKHFTSRGLYYQWGRKDPFLYPSGISSRTPAPAVYQNGFSYTNYSNATTIAYTIEHPTTYINSGSDWQLKLLAQINLWGNNSSNTSSLTDWGTKSIYDPCPPGWRVPDRRAWEKAAMRITSVNASYYFLCDAGSTAETFYPMSGFFYGSDYPNCGSWGYTWTNAPTADGASALLLQSANVHPTENMKRYYAVPVRCMRE